MRRAIRGTRSRRPGVELHSASGAPLHRGARAGGGGGMPGPSRADLRAPPCHREDEPTKKDPNDRPPPSAY
jgi:hypothetical protein